MAVPVTRGPAVRLHPPAATAADADRARHQGVPSRSADHALGQGGAAEEEDRRGVGQPRRQRGVRAAGLPPPGEELRRHRHDVGLAGLHPGQGEVAEDPAGAGGRRPGGPATSGRWPGRRRSPGRRSTRRAVLRAAGSSATTVVARPRPSPAPAATRKGRRQRPSTTAASPDHTDRARRTGPGPVSPRSRPLARARWATTAWTATARAQGDLGPVEADGVDRVEEDGGDGGGKGLLGRYGERGRHRERGGPAGRCRPAAGDPRRGGATGASRRRRRRRSRPGSPMSGTATPTAARAVPVARRARTPAVGSRCVDPGPVDGRQGEDDRAGQGRRPCLRSGGSSTVTTAHGTKVAATRVARRPAGGEEGGGGGDEGDGGGQGRPGAEGDGAGDGDGEGDGGRRPAAAPEQGQSEGAGGAPVAADVGRQPADGGQGEGGGGGEPTGRGR